MTRHPETEPRQKAPPGVFVAATIVIFFLSLSAADSVGFVPCDFDASCSSTEASAQADNTAHSLALTELPELGEEAVPVTALPERIIISSIGLDLSVQNPGTRDITALDEVLKDGPARYVDSAKLGEKGNVLIFAHSSHLPVVHNQMYRAFNRIPELKAGDTITLEGNGKSYLYTVTSLRTADASEAVVDLSPSLGTKLTLVTCDTLTSKSSRYILEADFVGITI